LADEDFRNNYSQYCKYKNMLKRKRW
jgi:hypothetical protein